MLNSKLYYKIDPVHRIGVSQPDGA